MGAILRAAADGPRGDGGAVSFFFLELFPNSHRPHCESEEVKEDGGDWTDGKRGGLLPELSTEQSSSTASVGNSSRRSSSTLRLAASLQCPSSRSSTSPLLRPRPRSRSTRRRLAICWRWRWISSGLSRGGGCIWSVTISSSSPLVSALPWLPYLRYQSEGESDASHHPGTGSEKSGYR